MSLLKTPLARKATGNHLMRSTSLGKTQSPVSGFCYARNRVCNAVNASNAIHITIVARFFHVHHLILYLLLLLTHGNLEFPAYCPTNKATQRLQFLCFLDTLIIQASSNLTASSNLPYHSHKTPPLSYTLHTAAFLSP